MKAVILTILLVIGLLFYSPEQSPAEIVVSSIGIDYKDGEYEVSLFNINTKTISKIETVGSVDESHSVIISKSSDLLELMSEISNSSYRKLSFSQVSSIVLTDNVLKHIELIEVINMFKYSILKYMNIYVYATEEKIEDVFNIGNIEHLSLYYSLLVDPMYKYSVKSFPKPVTVMEYLRDYYSYNEIKLPVISKSDVTITENDDKLDTIVINGYYFDRIESIEYNDIDRSMIYVNGFEVTTITLENVNIDIKNYKIKSKCRKNNCTLNVSYNVKLNSHVVSSSATDLDKALKNKITDILNNTYEKYKSYDIDIFNLVETSYRKNNIVEELKNINLQINVKQTFENAYI